VPDFDPVEGIMSQPEDVQRAMLIQAVRAVSRRQTDIFSELRYIKRSIYGLFLTIFGGLVLFVLTHRPG
jgi:hypothetical protein